MNADAVETGTKYHFEVAPITEDNRFQVMARVQPFHSQLALAKGRELRELYGNVDIGGEAVFAVLDGPEPRDLAVAVGREKSVILSGEQYRVYIRYLRVVLKDYQGLGIGTALTDEMVERRCPDAVTGRTPNPYVIRADEKSRYIGIIHPIYRLHTVRTAALLAATLPENYIKDLDFKTGLCTRVYPPGANRLFSLDHASARVLRIHRISTTPPISADLEGGDGYVYFEWVNKKLCTPTDDLSSQAA